MTTPLVTVIVTHHLDENRPLLNQCLDAAWLSQDVATEIIVLADTDTGPYVQPGVQLIHNARLDTATKKVHRGVELSDPGSKYFLLLSDDVVVGCKTIAKLVEGVGDNAWICNPMSNSDNGSRFVAPWLMGPDQAEMRDRDILRGWTGPQILVPQDYVSFYCTLIPRKVWNAVGAIDERLEVRHNDQDYCYRAARLGIPSMINFGAFAFHYGSRTLRKTVTPEQQAEASRVFQEKWSSPSAQVVL